MQKGLDTSVGNEVTAHADVNQSNTDSNGSLMFSVQFSGMAVRTKPLVRRTLRVR